MCCKYDFRVGIWRDFYKCAVIAGSTLFACVDFYLKTSTAGEAVVLSDYIFHLFRGMKPYIQGESDFEIPILWFTVNLYLAYLIGKYPREDLSRSGVNVLLKSKSRAKWWLSKCVWCVASVAIYYAVIYFVIVAFCVWMKTDLTLRVRVSGDSVLLLYSGREDIPYPLLFLLPVVCSAAISLLQMVLMFLTDVVYGFLAVAVLLLASAYLYAPFLIGNLSMLERCEYFQYDGFGLKSAYLICIALAVISVLAGGKFFERCDILGDNSSV
ncbi:MAG: hypothetical protein LUI10_13530 [Lachnospiraceae bacterium]|nr:hypothetical protein [Lachnospiraceae bacterium]